MSAGAQAERLPASIERRARSVWFVIAISALIFVALCALATTSLLTLLNTWTVPQEASLEPRRGSQLVIIRRGVPAPEAVTGRTTLHEGDVVSTGQSDEAFLELFDGSTVQVYFDTEFVVERLRTSRFFQNMKEVSLKVRRGTLLIATAGLGGYESANYGIATDDGLVSLDTDSKVRVQVDDNTGPRVTSVVADSGRARLVAQGQEVELVSRTLGRIPSGGAPEGPLPPEEDLIRNGHLTDGPTSGAEEDGLGIAGWDPLTLATSPGVTDLGETRIVTETIGSLGVVTAARFERNGAVNQYALVGMKQDINRAAEFLSYLEVRATIKVVEQAMTAGGPRGDLYPLTIRVRYTNSAHEAREWHHSFYFLGPQEMPDATRVEQAVWTPVQGLMLKSPEMPAEQQPDIAVINSIEIYGHGRGFQSWVTNVSLIAK
jgi:hypothetical protein